MKAGALPTRSIGILLVEDSPGDANLVRQMLGLSERPIHLEVAQDGQQALAFLRGKDFEQRPPSPDLILLDLGLPGKNGWEVLSELKEDSQFKKIPVLILTGSEHKEDERKGCFSEAADFVLKPKDWTHMVSFLNYLEENWFKKILDHPPAT